MAGWLPLSLSLSRSNSEPPSSSLLSEWNSYASSSSPPSTSQLDLESAVRSANDTVTATFNVVSKGVRDIPGNFQSATNTIPSGKALLYFGLLLITGIFFIFIAFALFLPVIVIFPQKFAISFTLGCGFIIGSFFSLKGPKTQLTHMFSNERLPFTLAFICTMFGTIYVSMVRHSYILSVIFSALQVLSLGYYVISYFPVNEKIRFTSKAMFESFVSETMFESFVSQAMFESFVLEAMFESFVSQVMFESFVSQAMFESFVSQAMFESFVLEEEKVSNLY